MAFNHENLKVYQRTLSFNAKVSNWTGQWDRRHAIADQLFRAAGSMLENIAMARQPTKLATKEENIRNTRKDVQRNT